MQPRALSEVIDVVADVPVVNVCASNRMRNVGDHWSAVGRHVRWVRDHGAMITLPEARALGEVGHRSPLQGKLVIVGGGGLVGPGPFESAVESIFPQLPAAVVFWGIGHNVLHGVGRDATTGWRNRLLMDGRTPLWPDYFSAARLVGVRDHAAGMPWVPCASCLSPALDGLAEQAPTHDVALINHYEQPIDWSAGRAEGLRVVRATNNTEDLMAVLRMIAAAPVVVSNSYHVLYWALLLGRGAVAYEPNNTRFDHLPWPIEVATAADWPEAVARAKPSVGALAEARAATFSYSTEVLNLAVGLGLLDGHPDPHRPVPVSAASSECSSGV
nr:hypothetical protein [uncultured Actinoplanes sp.]